MKILLNVLVLSLSIVAVAAADEPISDATGMGLLAKYKCQSCHSPQADPSTQGPSWRAIAKKYASDSEANIELQSSILNGSSGAWGSNTMPSFDIPQADLKKLVEWILAQFP
jgi:cytochrome c